MNRGADKFVILVVIFLVVAGLAAVYSSTAGMNLSIKKGDAALTSQFSYLYKQGFTLILGLLAMLVAYKLPLKYLNRLAIPILIISLICLCLVFTSIGVNVKGSRRWLNLGVSTFQPSEMVKLSMVIFMAWFMSREYYDKERFLYFLIPIAVMLSFQGIFLVQPDFGSAMSLAVLTVSMLFLSGTRLRYIFSLAVLALPAIVVLIMTPYRWKRVVAYLDPWKDAQGAGFQLTQSFIAFGSGGIQGVGIGESKQKLAFLPEVHTDFIFSLIGEELGFIGAVFVVALFIALFIRGFVIAQRTEAPFPYYLACGLSLMIAVQAVVNFAVVTGLVPTKGLPLPFISFGGSSLLISLTAVGLLLNVSQYSEDRAMRGMFRVGARSGDEKAANVALSRPRQYALGRGYGDIHKKARPYVRKGMGRA